MLHTKNISALSLLLVCFCSSCFNQVSGKTIRNRHYKYSIELPATMVEVEDSAAQQNSETYFDTTNEIVLSINSSLSIYSSVRDYVDCSKAQLENELRINYGDSTLTLLSCANSKYYANKTVVLYLHVGNMSEGFDQSLIYFVHHRNRDLQFVFLLKGAHAKENLKYIDNVMQKLKLL